MNKYKKEKIKQLGMNPGTAAAKLTRDILFDFVKKAGICCFRCGKELSREDFSIEHKIPWLHDEKAKELFFDLENITFSHKGCNIGAARRGLRVKHGTSTMYKRGCRCELCFEYKQGESLKYKNKKLAEMV